MDLGISAATNLPLALNVTFGSIIIVVLIFINHFRKYNTDRFQRSLFCSLLIFYFFSVSADLLFLMFRGVSGGIAHSILYTARSLYYLFLAFSYYLAATFIDYMVFRKTSRAKAILLVGCTVFVMHVLLLVFNYSHGFYFYIDPEHNVYHRGIYYFLRPAITHSPMLLVLADFATNHKTLGKSQIAMFLTLFLVFIAGSAVDFLLTSTYLIWPFADAALLYTYFFIVQADSRMDPLTGVGNRFSFNEFTDRLSRYITGDSWAIVMLDMDHFKAINDTLGHQEGDNALRDMAAIIRDCIKGTDFAARYGGDEFVLTIKVEKGYRDRVEKLIQEMQAEVDLFNAKKIRPFKLEFSYGYDIYTQDGRQPVEEFLNHIDSLMYRHKQGRRHTDERRSRAAV